MELDYQDSQIEKLAKLQERFEALDGYTMEAKAGEILHTLVGHSGAIRPLTYSPDGKTIASASAACA